MSTIWQLVLRKPSRANALVIFWGLVPYGGHYDTTIYNYYDGPSRARLADPPWPTLIRIFESKNKLHKNIVAYMVLLLS